MTSLRLPTAPAEYLSPRALPFPRERAGAERPVAALPASVFTVATLLDDAHAEQVMPALLDFSRTIGAPVDWRAIPSAFARGGTVGRIGVPQEVSALMHQQRVVIGSTLGGDPLAPVARLWRGMQRRADVLIDLRACRTMPGSAADRAGIERDVLLMSQRVQERSTAKRTAARSDAESADQWTRARAAAEIAFRLAAAEGRRLLLVLPVGRGTESQQLLTDALERQARLHRLPAPRTVKAGLLSALLTGDAGRERLLVVSVMPIEELSATACEAVGETGPWPVVSLGRDATFYDMPQHASGELNPLPFLLVLGQVLQRGNRADLSRSLMESVTLTEAARARMVEELGAPITVPVDAYLRGVLTNWGRTSLGHAVRERRRTDRDRPLIAGLRLRIETSHSAAAMREKLASALLHAGLEVASVRGADAGIDSMLSAFEVRIRSRLGEPALGDAAAEALAGALDRDLRCVAIEPWVPALTGERIRARTA
ncbi:MAG: hypothetical protein U5K74_16065 [Gemmatimonadaceae bacterium]|nr:hypothetical protein [Gemmatimonadaceae bacterium]